MTALPIVLASSSPYRRELLARLRVPFEAANPDIDESPLPDESAEALVARLALAKAEALASRFSSHLIIGSDQVACCDGAILTKPGSVSGAESQLRRQSGREVVFLTGLALLNSADGRHHTVVVPTHVHFRPLSDAEIRRYVTLENPLDCAGSFKCESLGISLFDRVVSDDPTALIGLPLIQLSILLRAEGVNQP